MTGGAETGQAVLYLDRRSARGRDRAPSSACPTRGTDGSTGYLLAWGPAGPAVARPLLETPERLLSAERASSSIFRAWARASAASIGARFSARAFSAAALVALAWSRFFLELARFAVAAPAAALASARFFSAAAFSLSARLTAARAAWIASAIAFERVWAAAAAWTALAWTRAAWAAFWRSPAAARALTSLESDSASACAAAWASWTWSSRTATGGG